MTDIEKMKFILRESEVPFFSNSELQFYLDENDGIVNDAVYQCLLVKAEDTTLNISGISAADSSAYFRRLASRYKPNNSGTLGGV
jgi:hypothetical protein